MSTSHSRLPKNVLSAGLIAILTSFTVQTASAQVHENGVGADPDRDTNPATITGVISRVGDAAAAADDAPYSVITFEPPPGKHGETISTDYKAEFGVEFGQGLSRQICEGQRRFYYDSMCTYEAAPSGEFAVGYLNHLNAPLHIKFEKPVCVATMAIYPTGGEEGEPFTVTINGWDENDIPLTPAKAEFKWTKDTVRWRHMAGAYYLNGKAKRIAISMKSGKASEAGDVLRFLMDDLAFVQEGCDAVLADFVNTADVDIPAPSYDVDIPPSSDKIVDEDLTGAL